MTTELTLQQITDRLAEEAGWRRMTRTNDDGHEQFWWERGKPGAGFNCLDHHPFPADDLNAAVRAVPEGMLWSVGSKADGFTALVDDHGKMSVATASHPAHALYFAIAKARGWM